MRGIYQVRGKRTITAQLLKAKITLGVLMQQRYK